MAADVPVGRVNRLDQAFADPHVQSRGMVVPFNYQGKEFKSLGNPIRLSGSPSRYDPPPAWGEHTEQLLSGMLGYSREKIEALRRDGVI